ncbi:MAG: hypothetical protein V4637_06660 [Pseudomonadota bacterium]
MALEDAKLQSFMGQFVNDFGAVMHAATIVVGDELGLYKALSEGALTAEALAEKAGTDPCYVREWLSSQAASGYVQFDSATHCFSMSEEQAYALAASTFICTPASRAQEGGMCLGAQAGEKRIREVVTRGSFSRFRRAAETPFNLIYEARK